MKRVPYLASTGFYRGAILGMEDVTAAPNRARLTPDLLLTVPVTGGAAALKRLAPEDLEISQHGRWQHTHLGALEAHLGRTPFWRHLEPEIAPMIAGAEGNLMTFNRSLSDAVVRFLDMTNLSEELREFARRDPARLMQLAGRRLRGADPSTPLLVEAARYGRDAIFLLVPAFIGG